MIDVVTDIGDDAAEHSGPIGRDGRRRRSARAHQTCGCGRGAPICNSGCSAILRKPSRISASLNVRRCSARRATTSGFSACAGTARAARAAPKAYRSEPEHLQFQPVFGRAARKPQARLIPGKFWERGRLRIRTGQDSSERHLGELQYRAGRGRNSFGRSQRTHRRGIKMRIILAVRAVCSLSLSCALGVH